MQLHQILLAINEYFRATEADQCLRGLDYFSRSWRGGHHQHIYYHEGHRRPCASWTSPVNSVSLRQCDYTLLSWGTLTWLVTVCFGPCWFTATGMWTILQILRHLCLINALYRSITHNNYMYQWPSSISYCLYFPPHYSTVSLFWLYLLKNVCSNLIFSIVYALYLHCLCVVTFAEGILQILISLEIEQNKLLKHFNIPASKK